MRGNCSCLPREKSKAVLMALAASLADQNSSIINIRLAQRDEIRWSEFELLCIAPAPAIHHIKFHTRLASSRFYGSGVFPKAAHSQQGYFHGVPRFVPELTLQVAHD